jgi:Ser/Thr protein kinase RdoA (MazF antagonist)
VPRLPWSPGDLEAALSAWSAAAAALAAPSGDLLAIGLPRLPDLVRDELSWWSEIAAGREPMPAAPPWVPARLAELAALEQALPAHAAGHGMLHGDLRVDNVLIGADGAWLCDWTWPCLGAPWFDTVTLLVSAYASGLDTDALLEPWGAPAEGVDGALAALGGYWLVRAAGEPSSASPHSRQHQRFSGTQALAWLADRRGWPTTA